MKLLSDLQAIYPIGTADSSNVVGGKAELSIRGISLPKDLRCDSDVYVHYVVVSVVYLHKHVRFGVNSTHLPHMCIPR